MPIEAMSSYRSISLPRNQEKAAGTGSPNVPDTYKQLDDYVKMTPAQRMRVDLLAKLGLSEEELAAMSAEERQAVELKLRELIQQQMEEAQAKQDVPDTVGQWIDTVA